MSEQRYVAEQVDVINEDETEVWDIVFDTDKTYAFMVRDVDTANDLCGLLNEQQSTIKQQDIEIKNLNLHIGKLVDGSEISQQLMKEYEKNDKLEAKIESMTEQHKARLDKLIEENGDLRMKMVEQQATINEYKENWDDMVKLATKTSLRNVELDEQIGQLRKELNDCEKFRYTVFKRMGELNDERRTKRN